MNIQGFLRWQFEGCFKSVSFYGMLLTFLGFAMVIGKCPMPWPAVVSIVGLILVMGDLFYSWFKFSYRIYEIERTSIMKNLNAKEQ